MFIPIHVECQFKSFVFANPALGGVSFNILQVPLEATARAVLSLPAVPVTDPAAHAAGVYGYVRMSTRLDPWGSGAVEIATRKFIPPTSVGFARAHQTNKTLVMRKQPPAGIGPVTSTLPVRASVFGNVFRISCIWQSYYFFGESRVTAVRGHTSAVALFESNCPHLGQITI